MLKELHMFCLKRLWRDLFAVYSYLVGGYREDAFILFYEVEGPRGINANLKNANFC